MQLCQLKDGPNLTLKITGSLDAVTVPDLRGDIEGIAESNGFVAVVVDLSELQLIDSSGVALLVSLYKRLRARGARLRVRGAHDQPLAILQLLRLDRVFELDA